MIHVRRSIVSALTASVLVLAACAPAAPPAPTAAPAKPAAPTAAPAAKPTTAPAKPAAASTTAPAKPAAAVPTTAAKPAGDNVLTPEVQRLIAAARDAGETQLAIGYAEDNFGGNSAIPEWEAAFNRMYGTNVKFVFTPGPSKDQTLTQLIQEVAAGRAAFTDIGILSATHIGELIRNNSLESYDYSLMSPRIKKEFLTPQNVGVEINTRTPGIAYNTRMIPPDKAPKSLEDALQPEWKGKIAATPTLAQMDTIAFHPAVGPDRMRSYISRLSEQVGGLIRGGETPRVASGEFLMLVVVSGQHDVLPLKAQGAPIDLAIPNDGATYVAEYAVIPKTAPHPNLAKLYINMLLSEEGQKIMYKHTFLDHAEVPGSQGAARVESLRQSGIQFFRADVQFELDHPEKVKLKDELVAMLRK
jgi:iron(III) transport system substrate-binding protein